MQYSNVYLLAMGIAILILTGCNQVKHEQNNEARISLSMAESVLVKESLVGVSLGEEYETIINNFGEPDETVCEGQCINNGCTYFIHTFASRNLRIFECRYGKSKEPGHVSDIIVSGDSKAETARGISIGSNRSQILQAYGHLVSCEEDHCSVQDDNKLNLPWKKSRILLSFDMIGDKVATIALRDNLCL